MPQPQDYTVGIFCPLPIEASAVQHLLDEIHHKTQSIGIRYISGKLSGHNIVVATLPFTSRGKVVTAIAASQLKSDFPNISHLLLVGIGGGIPSQDADIRLGDVVISTPSGSHPGVVQYDLGKRYRGKFERTGHLAAPPEEWLLAISQMKTDRPSRRDTLAQSIAALQDRCGRQHFMRPPPETDTLFLPNYNHPVGEATCHQCTPSQAIQRPIRPNPTTPAIHYGLILSGDSVIKNADERDQISNSIGNALCFEMEAAGMMNHFPCLVIRGICDYADSHKNDIWHEYAATAAAAVAKEVLGYIEPTQPLERHDLVGANTPECDAVFSGIFNAQNGKINNIHTISSQGSVYL
ncbi:purine and uridine phosphorylase [Aspergillus sclerotiicarbonarius CBS 121057]|uniref:Purine and uridine phosphorylase n=1 Tax=Aspergillus sclerotiicarbonarius (strain CBS 121057 / IBT 28362) TaxID=1448318 RepID=A0A319EC85_ASPSB|nr:purine and uridine phosphorylase [Aspergillus sclerotiicarbonarius CBS 121057]